MAAGEDNDTRRYSDIYGTIRAMEGNCIQKRSSFAAAFHGDREYSKKTQPALNILITNKEEISQKLKTILEKYFPHFNKKNLRFDN